MTVTTEQFSIEGDYRRIRRPFNLTLTLCRLLSFCLTAHVTHLTSQQKKQFTCKHTSNDMETSTPEYHGKCQCGAVTVVARAAPLKSFYCHCTICRRLSYDFQHPTIAHIFLEVLLLLLLQSCQREASLSLERLIRTLHHRFDFQS